MQRSYTLAATAFIAAICIGSAAAQQSAPSGQGQAAQPDDVRTLVGELTLDKYKATIKGLTAFGDRREGTERNRKAVDWIEAQLKSYGCETGRITYDPTAPVPTNEAARGRAGRGGEGRGRGRGRGTTEPRPTPAGTPEDPVRRGQGGKGFGGPTGVNNDATRQPDEAVRALDMEPIIPGPVPEVYCTKWGSTRPGEMYIISAHMDGIGYAQAANDNGSGTAIVMELARILNAPGVTTDVSIRFALWNGEEGGLRGARAYVYQRQGLQGKEDPPGSGKYPEPKWLGMIQHDMMMWDHGMPGPDGKLNPEQRREADVNVEFQENSKFAADAQKLAWLFKSANERYATDYPATVGNHMQSTDSVPFQDIVPAISMRENERRDHIGYGWDPNWHQPTDMFTTYSDKDFRLGMNAAQTTLAAIAQLTKATIKKP